MWPMMSWLKFLRSAAFLLALLVGRRSVVKASSHKTQRLSLQSAAQSRALLERGDTLERAPKIFGDDSLPEKSHLLESLLFKKSVRGGGKGKSQPVPPRWAVLSGILLALNSGFLNGCCLSGGVMPSTKQAVAAVTGTYTTSAVGIVSGNRGQFLSQMKILLSFISGSAIAGLMNPRPTTWALSPSCGPTLFLAAAIVWTANNFIAKGDFAGFCFAAVANGIQNSLTSTLSANWIRTTHYTGISSDMGTFVGQILRGNKDNLPRLKVFFALAISFWTGGFLSFYGTERFASSCLLVSAGLYAVLGLTAQMATR